MALDVLVPQHRQGDVLAFELTVDLGPIGLDVAAMTLLGADRGERLCFGHLCALAAAGSGKVTRSPAIAVAAVAWLANRAISNDRTFTILNPSDFLNSRKYSL